MIADLKKIYQAATVVEAEQALDDFSQAWDDKYPMIAKTWEKLEPYVLYERKRRNEPYYYEYAEKLAKRTLKWRETHNIHEQTHWVDHAL